MLPWPKMTSEQKAEAARKDDICDQLVPSDIRSMLSETRKLREALLNIIEAVVLDHPLNGDEIDDDLFSDVKDWHGEPFAKLIYDAWLLVRPSFQNKTLVDVLNERANKSHEGSSP